MQLAAGCQNNQHDECAWSASVAVVVINTSLYPSVSLIVRQFVGLTCFVYGDGKKRVRSASLLLSEDYFMKTNAAISQDGTVTGRRMALGAAGGRAGGRACPIASPAYTFVARKSLNSTLLILNVYV